MNIGFPEAVKIILNFEGGYSDHVADKGGKTKYGIMEGTLRAAQAKGLIPANVTIQGLTAEQAVKIYKANYWDAAKCGELPSPVNAVVFDCAVNHGVGGGVKLLQRAINALSGKQVVEVDGAIGPKTIAAAKALNPVELARAVVLQRAAFFVRICQNNPSQRVFFYGWIRARVIGLAETLKLV